MDFNTIKFKLSIDDVIHNKLTDRPDDQIPIYLVAFNDRDINDSQVCRIMVRNTVDGFEYVDRDHKNIFGTIVPKPLAEYIITQALL